MRRAYKSGARAAAPRAPAAPSLGHPTEGEPSTGIPATVPGAYWFDSITEEIVSVIEAAGLSPDDTQTQLRDAIRALARISRPPAGVVEAYAGSTVPAGYLSCDGSLVSRTTYAALYAAIGDTYGAGDGSTTFALPDLERRVVVGAGGTGTTTLADTVGATGGAETHTLTVAEVPAHNHGARTAAAPGHVHRSGSLSAGSSGSAHVHTIDLSLTPAQSASAGLNTIKHPQDPASAGAGRTESSGAHSHNVSGSTGSGGGHSHAVYSQGGGNAHSIMQPSVVMQWIISTG